MHRFPERHSTERSKRRLEAKMTASLQTCLKASWILQWHYSRKIRMYHIYVRRNVPNCLYDKLQIVVPASSRTISYAVSVSSRNCGTERVVAREKIWHIAWERHFTFSSLTKSARSVKQKDSSRWHRCSRENRVGDSHDANGVASVISPISDV